MAESAQPYVIPQEAIDSSNLRAIGYDRDRHVLAVTFKSGDIFHYADISPELALDFYAAESRGRFYAQQIRGKFTGQKMTGPCESCGDKGRIGMTCTDCGCGVYVDAPRKAVQ